MKMATKRPANGPEFFPSYKRYKSDPLVNSEVCRTSNLPSPIIRLQGHQGEIFTCEFHPDGEILLSAGADREIYIWSVFDKCVNMMTMPGHKGSIMEAHFSNDGENIFSCSTDKTVAVWDTFTGARLCQLRGHTSFVNSVNSTVQGISMLCSGSDDGTVRIWDERTSDSVHTISANYPITSTCFNSTGMEIIYAGIDNDITVWDNRMNQILYKLEGHADSVAGIALSPDGSCILSNSMDNSVKIWNINSDSSEKLCLKTFTGNQHTYEDNLLRCTWSKDCTKIAAGSSDCHVYIWDIMTERLLYKLPGPKAGVNDVDFHPKQPIIATATSDQTVYMGELSN